MPLSPEEVIQRIIQSRAIEGKDQKIIGELGDAAAVLVTKVVKGRNLSKSEADSVLTILAKSFADPTAVQVAPDREPKTTLFVLNWLESYTRDPELRARITHTRKYVLEQAEKAKKK